MGNRWKTAHATACVVAALLAVVEVVALRRRLTQSARVGGCSSRGRLDRSLDGESLGQGDLIEGLPSREAAILLGKRLGPGARFAHRAAHETVAPETPAEAARFGNGELVHAIFAAPIGKVAGPARYSDHWVLMVVRKMVPAGAVPLAGVEAKIAKNLSFERNRRAKRDFLQTYRRKWIARTSCSADFVVWGCSQYRGSSRELTNPLTAY